MKRVVIIDTNYLILRSFFGALNQTYGDLIHYAWGLIINKVICLFGRKRYDRMYFILEGKKEKIFKYIDFKDYKKNRIRNLPEDFRLSFRKIIILSKVFNIPIIKHVNYEADDTIASLTHLFLRRGYSIDLMTQDKDLFQLLKYRDVNVIDYALDGVSKRYLLEKLNISSFNKVADLLTLMGDSTDNLSGIKGIGMKKANLFLKKWSNINLFLKAFLKNRKTEKLNKDERSIIDQIRTLFFTRRMVYLNNNLFFNNRLINQTPLNNKKLIIEFLKKNHYYNLVDKLELISLNDREEQVQE